MKALQHHKRVETQWELLVDKVLWLEDVQKSSVSMDREFKHSKTVERHRFIEAVYTRQMGKFIQGHIHLHG